MPRAQAKTLTVTCPVCSQERTLLHDRRTGIPSSGGVLRCAPCGYAARKAAFAAERGKRPKVCVHCKERTPARACGLCRDCWKVPKLQKRYAVATPTCRRGAGQGMATPPLPAAPTYADPGSAARVEVMRLRAERGEAIFHPGDERVVIEAHLGRSGWTLSDFGDSAVA